MGEIELEFLDVQRGRDGHPRYYYFRRNGRRWKLPGAKGSAEFMAEYHRLVETTQPSTPAQPFSPRSLGALVNSYFADRETFKSLKPRSQRVYRIVLEALVKRIGQTDVRLIKRRHVKALRDEKAETPGMANLTLSVVSTLLKYAVDSEWIEHNPAAGIKKFKLGEHRAWTADECRKFEARWKTGTMQRRCYVLGKCTGQRAGDLAAMTRGNRWLDPDGQRFIHVVQEKTGKVLDIPETRGLTEELSHGEQGHLSLLTKADSSGFDGYSLGQWFAAAIDAADMSDDCVLHGLRKLTAKTLAEAGNSPHLIGSITGHEPDSPEIVRYTRQADQRKMATAAILSLEGNADRTRTAKRKSRPTAKQSGEH